MADFWKYHALGNDYLVLDGRPWLPTPDPARIQALCDRQRGIGADGILFDLGLHDGRRQLRIFNPDGSEAEKSGNGLRIFARYLWDQWLVDESPFAIDTPGGQVRCQVLDQGRMVTVAMGQVRFISTAIPVVGPPREVLQEPLAIADTELVFSAATIGNPHCVIIKDAVSAAETRRLGPLIEHAPIFPNRTNVQFVQVLDRHNLRIEIWERGAGYTLASGSSSCAAAAVAHRLGLCEGAVTVHCPGGTLAITIDERAHVTMSGPVVWIAQGTFSEELFG